MTILTGFAVLYVSLKVGIFNTTELWPEDVVAVTGIEGADRY